MIQMDDTSRLKPGGVVLCVAVLRRGDSSLGLCAAAVVVGAGHRNNVSLRLTITAIGAEVKR